MRIFRKLIMNIQFYIMSHNIKFNPIPHIQWNFHKWILSFKKEKLEVMLLILIKYNEDVEPLIEEGMWYSDIAIMMNDLENQGYTKKVGEGKDLKLEITEKGLDRIYESL